MSFICPCYIRIVPQSFRLDQPLRSVYRRKIVFAVFWYVDFSSTLFLSYYAADRNNTYYVSCIGIVAIGFLGMCLLDACLHFQTKSIVQAVAIFVRDPPQQEMSHNRALSFSHDIAFFSILPPDRYISDLNPIVIRDLRDCDTIYSMFYFINYVFVLGSMLYIYDFGKEISVTSRSSNASRVALFCIIILVCKTLILPLCVRRVNQQFARQLENFSLENGL